MSERNGTEDREAAVVEAASGQKKEKASEKIPSSIGKLFKAGKKHSASRAEPEQDSGESVKKLTRTELLELLIEETREADRLRAENEQLRKELEECRRNLEKAASLDAVIARLEAIAAGRTYR